jgi:glycosyltransferase involved in cell wall biosynthesis
MSEKILSICIPTYNREEYIKQRLEQFIKYINEINQGELIEIVVSDNASTDNTYKIIKEANTKYPYIIISRNKKNIGFSRNLVKVIHRAHGRYIWLFGDDDVLIENNLRDIITILIKQEPNFLIHNFFTFKDYYSNVLVRNFLNIKSDIYFKGKSNPALYFFKKIVNAVPLMSTNIMKREIALKFSTKFTNNNYWHFYNILRNMIKEGKIYIYALPLLGQSTTVSYFHENIYRKYNTFFRDRVEILTSLRKDCTNKEYTFLKKAYKKHIISSFFPVIIMLRKKKLTQSDKHYIKTKLFYLYTDIYLIYRIIEIMPNFVLDKLIEMLKIIRYIKLKKEADKL